MRELFPGKKVYQTSSSGTTVAYVSFKKTTTEIAYRMFCRLKAHKTNNVNGKQQQQ